MATGTKRGKKGRKAGIKDSLFEAMITLATMTTPTTQPKIRRRRRTIREGRSKRLLRKREIIPAAFLKSGCCCCWELTEPDFSKVLLARGK